MAVIILSSLKSRGYKIQICVLMSGDLLYNFLFILIYFPAVFIIYELRYYCCKNVISRVVVVVLLGSNKQVSTPKSSLLSQFRYKQVKTVKLDLDFEMLFLA